ncbi:MAG: phage portal protein [Sedimentisphaerales bacterium]
MTEDGGRKSRKTAPVSEPRMLSESRRTRVNTKRVAPLYIGGGYDAAQTNKYNSEHWLKADGRDADSTILWDLRTLRNRARYEIRNNPYAKGISETFATYLIGTGPRIQFQSDNPDLDREMEDAFVAWAENCDLTGRLSLTMILRQTCALEQDASGEGFILLTSTPKPRKNEAALRLSAIEADRIATPWMRPGGIIDEKLRDGIELDEDGRPVQYYVLDRHPGATFVLAVGAFKTIPADYMIHYYEQDRPGQTRGVPQFTPSLPLFAYLRRFTLATVQAAETAADISAVMEQEPDGSASYEAMDEIELARNAVLTFPPGGKAFQFKPEQPAASYGEFKGELLNEIARPKCMPFNIAAANSADYNYASGRMDHQIFYRYINTKRGDIEESVLSRIVNAWYREQSLINYNWPQEVPSYAWFWPGDEHVDPVKDATEKDINLRNGSTTYAAVYAQDGKDWEREFKQRKKEKDLLESLGLTFENMSPAAVAAALQDESNNNNSKNKKVKSKKK